MSITNPNHVTFAVDDVEPATKPLPEAPYGDALVNCVGPGAESYSRTTKPMICVPSPISIPNNFIAACQYAFGGHRPLILSPDMIWLLITQGLARHINLNAEALRYQFVTHAGKLEISVQRDEFVKGFAGNDWEGVFTEFSARIREYIGDDNYNSFVSRFSTTGPVEQAAMEIALLDGMQSYFDLVAYTGCGIPSITLEGISQDWEQIQRNAQELRRFGLGWWLDRLNPVLEQFVHASRGYYVRDFWQAFYKPPGESGGPHVRGHVTAFFPYLYDRSRNLVRAPGEDIANVSDVPPGLASVPFQWTFLGTFNSNSMELVAGFVGTCQVAGSLALRPEIGWVVREAGQAETLTLIRAIETGYEGRVLAQLRDWPFADRPTPGGKTALMAAAGAIKASEKIVQQLLDMGSDPTVTDEEGRTALDYAITTRERALREGFKIRRGIGEGSLPEVYDAIIEMLTVRQ